MDKQTITVIMARPAVEAKHYKQALEAFKAIALHPLERGAALWIEERARELAHAEQEKQE